MSLNNPDSRRALRSIVQAVVALSLVALLYWITGLLSADVAGLRGIARGALIICGLGTLLYGAENVSRSVTFRAGPLAGGIGDEVPAAAQAVADSAQATATDIKDAGK